MIITMFVGVITPMHGQENRVQAADTDLPINHSSGTHWAEKAMQQWKQLGLIQGDRAQNLEPDRSITRAEFITIINRLFGFYEQFSNNGQRFNDVDSEAWYASEFTIAQEAGYIKGYADGSVKPKQLITREEAALIVERLFSLHEPANDNLPFTDAAGLHSDSLMALAKLASNGILLGYSDGTIRPKHAITRAEVVTILSRIVPNIINQENAVMNNAKYEGNVMLSAGGAQLNNCIITGDLYIAEGVDSAEVYLSNVTVQGKIIILGGQQGIVLHNTTANGIDIGGRSGELKLSLKGTTSIGALVVQAKAAPRTIILDGTFSTIIAARSEEHAAATTLIISGSVERLVLQHKTYVETKDQHTEIAMIEIEEQAAGSEIVGKWNKLINYANQIRANGVIVPIGEHVREETINSGGSSTVPNKPASYAVTLQQGAAPGTTKAIAKANGNEHLVVQIMYNEDELLAIGEMAPSGGTVINPYQSAADISGVDPHINRFIAVYWVDQAQRIIHAKLMTVEEKQIAPSAWNLVWSDEFEGSEIDAAKWNFVEKGDGFGNNELQYYTAREENARVEDGHLIIEAREESYEGLSYTSAKLTTERKASWTYGKFEIHAKLPQGQGMWPALWMMPEDMDMYGTWPSSGEIDLVELVGHEMDTVHGTLHYGNPHISTGYSYQLENGESFADDFHTFTTEWEPGEMRWYVDGKLYAVQQDWYALGIGQPTDYTYPAPFDRDFYMQMNVAVGGIWPGAPDASTVFPQQMVVDYVRVYEMDEAYGYRTAGPTRPGPRDNGLVTEGKQPLADGNYIYNGKFDETSDQHVGIDGVSNSSFWAFRVGDNGKATIANDQAAMKLSIENGGDASHTVQLIQHPVPLEMGQSYKVTFDAKAAADRHMEVKLGSGGEGGWADYAVAGFPISTDWAAYEFTFSMQSYSHATASIEFNAGGAAGDLWLDNIKLQKVEANEEQLREPLADGNYIYNGGFDQGLNRLGYWSFKQKGSVKGTVEVSPKAAEKFANISIEKKGNIEDIALEQSHIVLHNKGHYVLSFDSLSSIAAPMQIVIENAKSGKRYLDVKEIPQVDAWGKQQYHFEFKEQEQTEVKLSFFAGEAEGRVSLDHVRLEELTVYDVSEEPLIIQAEQYTYNDAGLVKSEGSSKFVELNQPLSKLSYMVQFQQGGKYQLAYRIKTTAAASLKHGSSGSMITLPNTNGEWTTIYSDELTFTAGLQFIELLVEANDSEVGINWFGIIPAGKQLEADPPRSLVKNGGFHDDLANWEFWTEAEASITNDNASSRIDIQAVGAQSWSTLMKQGDLLLENGRFYTLSFNARASHPRPIVVGIENNYNARLMNDQQLQLTTSNQLYSFDFEMTGATELGALVFQLGNIGNAAALGKHKVWIDSVVLEPSNKVDPISFTLAPGTEQGTTIVQAVVSDPDHQLAVIVNDKVLPIPNYESKVPQLEHVYHNYVSGTNIFGVDPIGQKYIALYEVDKDGNVIRFSQKVISQHDIRPIPAENPAPELTILSVVPGDYHSTVKIDAALAVQHHLVAQISNIPLEVPSIGERAPTGGTVVNPYTPGTNLSGADAEINRYIGLYEVDAEQRITAFSLITLQENQVNEKQWTLTWQDEFDQATIDETKWNFVSGGGGYGNQELQNYTSRLENARIEDGKLVLEARKENYGGHSYTSAKLETSGKASWTYGKFEIRAKLPVGQGLWPAIWMMPEDMDVYGGWPASGEIDIMESLGHEPGVVYGTLHYGVEHADTGYGYVLPGGGQFSDDFHIFSTEWEPGEIRFYVDGILFAVQNDWFSIDPQNPDVFTYPAPFDRDFYMQLNVAVGGIWPGYPDASTVFPQQMQVDYVRVYELAEEDYRKTAFTRPGPRDTSGTIGQGRPPLENGNLIYNGGFDAAPDVAAGIAGVEHSAYWTFNDGTDFGASATAAYDNGWMKMDVSSGGAATYAVQLIQAPVALEMNKTYRVSFKAKSSQARNIEVKLSQGGDGGWTDYGKGNIAISTEPDLYEYTFKMLSNTHFNARLELNVGGATGSVWFDNIVLEKVTDELVIERQPLFDGNYIYNGGFELGTDFMSYWSFMTSDQAAATATVQPRIYERQLTVQINDAGQNAEDIVLEQRNLPLEEHEWYELTFAAKSSSAREITVQVAQDGQSAVPILYKLPIVLTEDMEIYKLQFQMTEATTFGGKLQFLLGGDDHSVTIDDVAIKKYFPPLSKLVEAEDMNISGSANIVAKKKAGQYVSLVGADGSLTGSMEVAQGGSYVLSLKLSSISDDKLLNIQVGAERFQLHVPNTHGYEKWMVMTQKLNLAADDYAIVIDGAGVNLDWIELSPELVENGDFSAEQLEPWVLWVGTEDWAGSARAAMHIDNEALVVDIPSLGSQFWSVQLNQQPLHIQQGKTYRLSFKGSSTTPRNIRVAVELDGGYPQYLLQDISLDEETEVYSIDFKMDAMSQPNGKLNFILGRIDAAVEPHQVWLDDISLTETRELVPTLAQGTPNVALRKRATASEGDAALAFDGNMASRWETSASDPQFIMVDLGEAYVIDHIKLDWEGAYGKKYELEVSLDEQSWTTVYETSYGDGGIDDIYFPAANARYIRLNGHERGMPYGYSLYEFAVYAHDEDYVSELLVAPELLPDSSNAHVKQDIEISFTDVERWRNSIQQVELDGVVLNAGTDYMVEPGQIILSKSLFSIAASYTIIVKSLHYEDASVEQLIERIPPSTNLALQVVSSSSSGNSDFAFDNNPGTRWESDASDPQSIMVDLAEEYEIGRIVLNWEGAYGKSYSIEGSLDGKVWNTIYETESGSGGIEEILFDATTARYARLVGTERGTPYSYSLWSFEIYPYDPSGLKLPPAVKPSETTVTVGEEIIFQFIDQEEWRDQITSIIVNELDVTSEAIISAGSIIIPSSFVNQAGAYLIEINATGYRVVHAELEILAVNLAIGATATASSSEDTVQAIVDQQLDTRWESEHGIDPQWVIIDIDSVQSISEVLIHWEAARASEYTVEVSEDGEHWDIVADVTDGTGLRDQHSFASTAARYIKIHGTGRALPYGYSIFEVMIYS